jgi:hypothetical protein
MTGPSRPFPIGISSEVSSPGSVLPVGSGAPDLVLTRLQFFRVGTVGTWTAPACDWSLATCYGSRLLPLRLPLNLQLGDAVYRTSQAGLFAGFASPLAPRDSVRFFRR